MAEAEIVGSAGITTLVTGGTGFIGSSIVRRLVDGRETVQVLSRTPIHLVRSKREPGALYIKGNVQDEASLVEGMKGCWAVINAAQFDNAPFENSSKGLTYLQVDGEGTERQVAAAKKAGVQRFIYISGAGTREGRIEPWFRGKLMAEKAVRESGLNWTIFRPSWVYGPGDRSLNKFAMFARFLPFVPIIGTGKEKIQPVYVEDLSKIIQLALRMPSTYEKIFEVGGPEELTMRQIAKTMLKAQEKKRFVLPHPKPLMKLLATFVQFLPGRPLTPAGIDFVTMEEKVDNAPLLSAFDIHLTPLESALAQYLGKKRKPRLTPNQRVAV